jgi:hypothetical protein
MQSSKSSNPAIKQSFLVLRPDLKRLLDLLDHLLRVGGLLERFDLRIVGMDAEMSHRHLQHREHLAGLLLGEKVHLKVEVVTAIREALLAVLADEDKRRQEDRFDRDDQIERAERRRIPAHGSG